jgi:hypothetical protein
MCPKSSSVCDGEQIKTTPPPPPTAAAATPEEGEDLEPPVNNAEFPLGNSGLFDPN